MIRVLVSSAAAIAQAGLEAMLRTDPEIEVLLRPPADLSASVAELYPDVLVLDLNGGGAPRSDDLVPPNRPVPAVILLADDRPAVWRAASSHIRAVLAGEATASELIAAVKAAAAGMAVLHPEDLRELLQQPQSREEPSRNGIAEPLTPREIQVLRMLADGEPNKTIAWKLEISEHTVKFHVASILGKLGANSRTEAVTLGIRQGLIPL